MSDAVVHYDRPDDPAMLGYPPTLPIEVALGTAPVPAICEAYGLNRDDWEALVHDRRFRKDVAEAREMLKAEGMSFKVKARLQSEELLKKSWAMIHDAKTPAAVRADLLKFTVRCAGLYEDGKAQGNTNANNLQININLS